MFVPVFDHNEWIMPLANNVRMAIELSLIVGAAGLSRLIRNSSGVCGRPVAQQKRILHSVEL